MSGQGESCRVRESGVGACQVRESRVGSRLKSVLVQGECNMGECVCVWGIKFLYGVINMAMGPFVTFCACVLTTEV